MVDKLIVDGLGIDYWRFAKPDPRGLDSNPFINPPKLSVPDVSSDSKPVGSVGVASVANVASDFITLDNIVCVDASGNVIEKYDKLEVRKDIGRNSDNSQVNFTPYFTPYNATVHFENQGLFLPSFALSCNILAALYANKSDVEIARVLNQYNGKGNGIGWHAQNTLVDWSAERIIHYPSKSDYTSAGGAVDINQQRQRKLSLFYNIGFQNVTLGAALNDSNYKMFLQNLTGLQNPEVLVDIGKYFGMTATIIQVSSIKDTRAVRLGCNYYDFGLLTYYFLGSGSVARGVRLVAAADGAKQKR